MKTGCLLQNLFREKAHYNKSFEELVDLQSAALDQKDRVQRYPVKFQQIMKF